MKFGVPLVPLLAIVLPGFVAGVWLCVLVAWFFAPLTFMTLGALVLWMRWLTSRDDQRLMQMVLKVKLMLRNRNRRLRDGAHCYAPAAPRRKFNAWLC